jgi:hemoglobin-like flavoprotein
MLQYCSFSSVETVISSWEIARQQASCGEDIGVAFLSRLFATNPETKHIFGFKAEHDVLNNPRLQIGVLVHAKIATGMLNDLIMNIGFDFHDIEWMLIELADYLTERNIDANCVLQAVEAAKETLKESFGKKWTKQYEDSWSDFLSKIATMIVHLMVKR